jgi:hypothetical protein
MKKILVLFLFLVAAVASFAQIDSIKYPARKMPFGNWDFIWTNGTLTDTVKVYPEKGGIGLDTLFFSDGTTLSSDTGLVKTTGDSLFGTFSFSNGSYFDDYEFYFQDGLETASFAANGIVLNNGAGINSFITNTRLNIQGNSSACYIGLNGLTTLANDTSLADDGSIVYDVVIAWGEVYVFNSGAIDQWAEFIISTDGSVYLKSNSTDVATTDTDNKFCIFDNGTGFTIRNRLGGTRTIKYIIHY